MRTWALAALLVAAFLVQTFSTLRTTAPTYDEVAHLPAGYAELATGHASLNPEHPPLAKLIAAAALWPQGGNLDSLSPSWRELNEWQFGKLFVSGTGRDPTAIMTRARRGPILIGLLLCLTCFVWSMRLFGPAGGLFTFALCVFSPTLLAHARLVTTDVPVAAFGVLAAFLAWRLLERPTVARAVGTGMALGATLASKFSGVIFIPALGLAAAITLWPRFRALRKKRTQRRQAVRRGAMLTAVVVASSALVVLLSYGWPPSLGAYIDGISTVGVNLDKQFPHFLLDQWRSGGFSLYFPAAFLLKTSPAVLIAIVVAATLPLLRRAKVADVVARVPVGVKPFLWLAPIAYGAFILLTAPDIGIRYLIPLFPFLWIGLGLVGAALWSKPAGKSVLLALIAIHMWAAVRAWPDPISYFNGLAGCSGPAAYHCLNDSNFDWGQDLGRVAKAVDHVRRPGDEVVLLYFGSADPSAYLDNWRAMQDQEVLHPQPELYAASISQLNWGMYKLGRPNGVDWFQLYTPIAVVGNTYFIYDFRPRR